MNTNADLRSGCWMLRARIRVRARARGRVLAAKHDAADSHPGRYFRKRARHARRGQPQLAEQMVRQRRSSRSQLAAANVIKCTHWSALISGVKAAQRGRSGPHFDRIASLLRWRPQRSRTYELNADAGCFRAHHERDLRQREFSVIK